MLCCVVNAAEEEAKIKQPKAVRSVYKEPESDKPFTKASEERDLAKAREQEETRSIAGTIQYCNTVQYRHTICTGDEANGQPIGRSVDRWG